MTPERIAELEKQWRLGVPVGHVAARELLDSLEAVTRERDAGLQAMRWCLNLDVTPQMIRSHLRRAVACADIPDAEEKPTPVVQPTDSKPDADESAASKNVEAVRSFTEFCKAHPDYRFWQALRNWSGARFIFARTYGDCVGGNLIDTFYLEGGNLSALPKDVKLEPSGGPAAQGVACSECGRLQNVINDMLRCTGRNAANIDDPIEVIKMVYRELVQLRMDTKHQVENLADLRGECGRLRAALAATKCQCSKAVDAKCPKCGEALSYVRNDSALNDEQLDSIKAGEWYCAACKDAGTKSGFKYFWERELPIITYQQCDRCAALASKPKPEGIDGNDQA